MQHTFRLAALLCCAMAVSVTAFAQPTRTHLVLTTLQATYSITSALASGTRIRVTNVPPGGAAMASHVFALTRVDDAVFRQAEAVVTVGKLWRDDPLYSAARARNLRVINIDATFPWDPAEPGVGVIRKPVNTVSWASAESGDDPGLSRYVWLSATNALRMAELVARDLQRLSPPDAARIESNLQSLTGSMRQMSANYGSKFAALPDPRVLSLADEFVYLLADLGVYVDGWFMKQDVDWTDADCAALTDHLKRHDIPVVVHKWQPDDKIAAAITSAGAKLVVLDTGDPGVAAAGGELPVHGFQALLDANMRVLLSAFADADAQRR